MAALEAFRSPQRVSPETGPQLPQLSPMAAPDNTTPLQTIGEKIRAKLIGILGEGIVDHPGVAACWACLNYDPVIGLGTTWTYRILGELYHRPDIEETLRYARADRVLRICGPWGIKALIQHFAPDISIDELERRIALGSADPLSKQLTKAFGSESPFLDEHKTYEQAKLPGAKAELLPPVLETRSQSIVYQQDNRLAQRISTLQQIRDTLLDPRHRALTRVEYVRAEVLVKLAHEFLTASVRRIDPHLSYQEMIDLFEMVKKSFAMEEAPEALEAMLKFFSQATTGLADLTVSETKEPKYPHGGIPPGILTELGKQMVDAAWGLVSVAQRANIPEVKASGPKWIDAAEERLKTIYSSWDRAVTGDLFLRSNLTASLQKAMTIIGLTHQNLSSFNRSWLAKYFGVNESQQIYTREINPDGEVTLRLDMGLPFLRSGSCIPSTDDTPIFTAIALGFPFNDKVTVEQRLCLERRGLKDWINPPIQLTRLVVNTRMVREQLLKGPPNSDDAVKSFISLEGTSSPIKSFLPITSGRELVQVYP